MPKQSPNESSKPLHDWRENVREFVIVLAGVFVALIAQQAVEAWDWSQKVGAAETAMKRELLWDDGPQIYQRAMMYPCLRQRLDAIRSAVEDRAPRDRIVALIGGYQVFPLTYDVVAQQAATASDVTTHVKQDVLEPYMLPYAVMPGFGHTAEVEQEHIARLHALSGKGGPLSETESADVLNAVELLRNDNLSMYSAARWSIPQLRKLGTVDLGRLQEFTDIARQSFGSCIKPLPADFPKGIPIE